MRQLWSIHQWRCQKIDWVLLHGDDLFLENFVRELMLTANKLFVKDITTQFPPPSNHFFQLIRETTLALLKCPNFCVPLQYHNNRFSLARTHFQNGTCGTRILSGTLPRVGKWMELSLFHTGDLEPYYFNLNVYGMWSVLLWMRGINFKQKWHKVKLTIHGQSLKASASCPIGVNSSL